MRVSCTFTDWSSRRAPRCRSSGSFFRTAISASSTSVAGLCRIYLRLARLFHIVLVGYSANDPPMRYLLNAVAADGTRFRDLKERFTFTGGPTADPVVIEDWKGRGITPITYDAANGHSELVRALTAWSELSAINGSRVRLDNEIKSLVGLPRAATVQPLRDRFDHLYRRASPDERIRIAAFASACGADLDWLTAIGEIDSERGTPS